MSSNKNDMPSDTKVLKNNLNRMAKKSEKRSDFSKLGPVGGSSLYTNKNRRNISRKLYNTFRDSSYGEVPIQRSKSKIVLNTKRTNNIISHIEKLIHQNFDVELGTKTLQADNLNPFFHVNKNSKIYNDTICFPKNSETQKKLLPSMKSTLQKHDSLEELMFSKTFKEKSGNSQLDIERNKLSNLLNKDSIVPLPASTELKNSLSECHYFDCNAVCNDINLISGNCNHHRTLLPPSQEEVNLKQQNSSKMLVNFKTLLDEYLKSESTSETKLFLSKNEIELLRNIVDADEQFNHLQKVDYVLLKELLISQLKEIELHQQIVRNILKMLRVNNQVKQNRPNRKNIPSSQLNSANIENQESNLDVRGKLSIDKGMKVDENKDKIKIFCRELIMQAKPINYSNQKSRANHNSTQWYTDVVLNSKTALSESNKNIGEEFNTIGIKRSEYRVEGYIIIENLQPTNIVYPEGIIIAVYPLLEFVKQSIALETLKKIKEVYIPKKGSQFELEKINYENSISNPGKLERVLKIKKKCSEKLEYKHVNAEAMDKVLSVTDSKHSDIDQIGLTAALYESYDHILQNIDELNQYIKQNLIYSYDVPHNSKSEICTNKLSKQRLIEKREAKKTLPLNERVNEDYNGVSLEETKNDLKNSTKRNSFSSNLENLSENQHLSEYADTNKDHFVRNSNLLLQGIPENENNRVFDEESSLSNIITLKFRSSAPRLSVDTSNNSWRNNLKILFQIVLFGIIFFALTLQEPACI